MIVEISSAGPENSREWCVIEFQGEITGDVVGNELGSLRINSNGSVEMVIDQNTIEGSIMTLKSPLLIFEKERNDGEGKEAKPLEVQGIVRKKVVFKSRPKPINS